MEFARLRHDGLPIWCIIEDETAYRVDGDVFNAPSKGVSLGPVSNLKTLNAADPITNKVICLLGNWGDQPENDGPGIFIKPTNTMVGAGDTVIYPDMASTVHIEPELAVIIGKTCSYVSPEEAKSRIFGYCCANDTTAFGMTRNMLFPFLFGKAFDTFCSLGPRIVTGIDPGNLTLRAALNGEEFVNINTSLMTWDVYTVISWLSQVMTLYSGDAIMMGAPPGFNEREVKPGDTMKVTIDGVGVLENPVRARA